GLLRNLDGERFMPRYHAKAELAPRDIVARAIVAETEQTQADHVLLDISHQPARKIIARFPQIYRFCLENGLDITQKPIPVSPAAHYTIGGVRTTVWGETTVRRLYACGEAACTAAHGANRLASNSLLETVVFANRVVRRSLESPDTAAPLSAEAIDLSPPAPAEAPKPEMEALRSLMWEEAGIVRDGQRLARARAVLAAWQAVLPSPADRPSQELANLLTCGRLVAEAALLRRESRGAHYRSDFPEPSPDWQRHIVFRKRT
ncbi:MAG: FAD-binding protein, partial [Dehalococcoidia bacterium]